MIIAVLGLWHQGVVAAACLADWQHQVIGADLDVETIARLNTAQAPLFEPGLNDLLSSATGSGLLRFTTDISEAVASAELVLVAVDTAVDANDRSDLSTVTELVDRATATLRPHVVLHVTAQVPVGTCDAIRDRVRSRRPDLVFGVTYSPENLKLGQAIARFRKPPLPVIGSDDASFEVVQRAFLPAGVEWRTCGVRTAEMVKHALNAFLALSVGFANEIGRISEAVGADGHRVGELLKLEPRVGAGAPLLPGLGFSGGTLARDVQTLREIAADKRASVPLLDGLWSSNGEQNRGIAKRIESLLQGLQGRTISILGLTYKPDTSTLRRSAALEVIAELLDGGATVRAHDPRANRADVPIHPMLSICNTPLDCVTGANALVLMTPWSDYKAVDFDEVRARAEGAGLVFDTAGLWRRADVEAAGLTYVSIGRGSAATPTG